jgi:hypothetical protein
MKFYYFGAMLPSLSLENPPPFSVATFIQLCRQHLPKEDCDALEELVMSPGPPPPEPRTKPSVHGIDFFEKWQEMEVQLRNAIVKQLAGELGKDPVLFCRSHTGINMMILKGVQDAFASKNPLERELALDKLRWKLLDELAGFDPFSESAILSYGLKLKLVERWSQMNHQKGQKKVENYIATLTSQNNTLN